MSRLGIPSTARASLVDDVKITANEASSIVQIGDNQQIEAQSDVLAVQRQISRFWEHEGDLQRFPIFQRPIKQAAPPKKVQVHANQSASLIHVESIDIIGLSASSVFQIGSNRSMQLQSKTMHIRHFITK